MDFIYKGRRQWFCQETGSKKEVFDLEAFGTLYPFPVNEETKELADQLSALENGAEVKLSLSLLVAAKPKKAKSK